MNKITIAIDGYSSCGKSTLAKQLAKELGYTFVDTGAMYRAVTVFAIENGFIQENEVLTEELIEGIKNIDVSFVFNPSRGASDVCLNGENIETSIRQMVVSDNVSHIAAIKEVRQKLVTLQQEMGVNKGVVMDGRDIGTVVFPYAELKLFMTASPEIRAQRRYDELLAKGDPTTMEEVRTNLEKRDLIDTTRKEDPLRQAEDAVVLDNSNLTQEEQLQLVLELVRERI